MTSTSSAVFLFVAIAIAAATGQSASVHDRIAAHVKANAPAWIELRRDLHRHPELSGQEQRTAGIVATRLKALGLSVQTGVGGHGVVGMLTGGRPGPLVAYRADMDAVRSTLPDPASFPSTVAGVRHICGHDVHVAVGLGLASALASVRKELPGRVMFIFQPSEERATGARAMLDAGLFAKEKPAAIFGVHASPLEVGTFTSKAGQMMFANQVAPGVTNDAALYAASRDALVAAMGPAAFTELQQPPAGFSEDFGEFQKVTPGVFFFIGLSNTAKGLRAMPHAADFNVDEAGIGHTVRAMAAVVVGRMNR